MKDESIELRMKSIERRMNRLNGEKAFKEKCREPRWMKGGRREQ